MQNLSSFGAEKLNLGGAENINPVEKAKIDVYSCINRSVVESLKTMSSEERTNMIEKAKLIEM